MIWGGDARFVRAKTPFMVAEREHGSRVLKRHKSRLAGRSRWRVKSLGEYGPVPEDAARRIPTKGCGVGWVSGRVYLCICITRSGTHGEETNKNVFFFKRNARTDRYRRVGTRFSGRASGGRWRGWLPGVEESGGGIRETRVYTRGRQEVVFKWITVPADDSAGKKQACDNLTDGVGDYPAMRNIRAKKTAAAGKVKKRPRACINVINNNGRRRWRREKPAPDRSSPPTQSSHNI